MRSLGSGRWDRDIGQTMRDALALALPDGEGRGGVAGVLRGGVRVHHTQREEGAGRVDHARRDDLEGRRDHAWPEGRMGARPGRRRRREPFRRVHLYVYCEDAEARASIDGPLRTRGRRDGRFPAGGHVLGRPGLQAHRSRWPCLELRHAPRCTGRSVTIERCARDTRNPAGDRRGTSTTSGESSAPSSSRATPSLSPGDDLREQARDFWLLSVGSNAFVVALEIDGIVRGAYLLKAEPAGARLARRQRLVHGGPRGPRSRPGRGDGPALAARGEQARLPVDAVQHRGQHQRLGRPALKGPSSASP